MRTSKQHHLPPSSARTLHLIESETAGAVAYLETRDGITLTREQRERVIDYCLLDETQVTAARLHEIVMIGKN